MDFGLNLERRSEGETLSANEMRARADVDAKTLILLALQFFGFFFSLWLTFLILIARKEMSDFFVV